METDGILPAIFGLGKSGEKDVVEKSRARPYWNLVARSWRRTRTLERMIEAVNSSELRRLAVLTGRAGTKMEQWLAKAQQAIPQDERDEKRAAWMFQKVPAFARVHGEELATVPEDAVLRDRELVTRRGHKEWPVMQAFAVASKRGQACAVPEKECGTGGALVGNAAAERRQWIAVSDSSRFARMRQS